MSVCLRQVRTGRSRHVAQSTPQISHSDLSHLLDALEVNVAYLTDCVVNAGWRVEFEPARLPGICYTPGGHGIMNVGNQPPITLTPHTLVIIPPGHFVAFEVIGAIGITDTAQGRWDGPAASSGADISANEPQLQLICGCLSASIAGAQNVFAALDSPISETFFASDQLDCKLASALTEFRNRDVGVQTMTSALLKPILVMLFRRSLNSTNLWVERFPMLGDPHITRALAAMVAAPGDQHTVSSLSQHVAMSRSVFMSRFTAAFGDLPMTILRQIRMHRAAVLLTTTHLSIEQVSYSVGYASRSSFFRAFRSRYGSDPREGRRGRSLHHQNIGADEWVDGHSERPVPILL